MGSEVISVVERRRRWPREKKLAVLMEALTPGASVTAIADRHGVARTLVYTWLRLAREGRLDGVTLTDAAQPAFVPVEVASAVVASMAAAATPTAATAPAISPTPARRRTSQVEIRLGNGRVVKVDEGIDPVALGAIVAALDGGVP